MAEAGVLEVVVTGVQISHYRDGAAGLHELTRSLLDETPVPRLRLTSIAPWRFDRRLLDLWRDRRLCRHLHMSLQSGCDATLRRMRRPYTAEAYLALVDEVRAAVPGVAVTTDVIVGFPGETGDEFAESLAFVRRAAFAKVHAFPYSSRPGTEAATMPGQVAHAEKRRRTELMLAAADEAEYRFRAAHLGTEAEVLWEGERDGRWHGTSDNYLKVFADAAADSPLDANTLTPARLARLAPDGLHAELPPA